MTPALRPPPESAHLRPCPWCGVAPERDGYGYYHLGTDSQEIHCTNDECRIKPSVLQHQHEYGEWSLEDAWNRCTPPPDLAGTEVQRDIAEMIVEKFGRQLGFTEAATWEPISRAVLARIQELTNGK